jgi:hypothetical protein
MRKHIHEEINAVKRHFQLEMEKYIEKIDTVMSERRLMEHNISLLARGKFKTKQDLNALNQTVLSHINDPLVHDNGYLNQTSSKFMTGGYAELEGLPAKLDEVLSKVASLSTQVSQIRADVKFYGLGFRDPRDAENWVEEHMGDSSYGVIVEVHLVFEHLYAATASDNESTLKQLNGLNKLKIDNISQSFELTSFETRIPKLFSKHSTISGAVSKRSAISYFDQIPSYADWAAPGIGFRDRLTDELVIFDRTHSRVIEETLEGNPVAYGVSGLALTESKSWISLFMNYLDDTYNDLTQHDTFSPDKAW